MGFSPELLKQLIATFQTELDEGCLVLTNGLVEIESCKSADQRAELIEKIFRTAHNLKGASRGLGITSVGDITHSIETMFAAFKNTNAEIPKSVIDICLEAVDKMRLAMTAFVNQSPPDFDLQDLLSRMNKCVENRSDIQETKVTEPVKREHAPAGHSNQNETRQSAAAQSLSVETMRVPLKVIDQLSRLAEEIQSNKIQFDHNAHTARILLYHVNEFTDVWNNLNEMLRQIYTTDERYHLRKSINHANDLLMETTSRLSNLFNSLSTHATDYSRLSHSIYEEVGLLRLVPANNYLGLLPLYVRDLSSSLGKKIDLAISGGDVYIDKYVLEGLKDPINHILRNAIDHGIESPDVRLRAGKNENGSISISVREAGGKVIFEISDDGAGLDLDKIKSKAVSLGIDKQENIDTLSSAEIYDFIFQSGFSTKTEITNVSGRGVGMDVVKKNVQALKGKIEIRSEKGKGTTFVISVPLSLSSERGLIVRCDNNHYVIPTAYIERVYAAEKNEAIPIEGGFALVFDDHPVQLKSLAVVLGNNEAGIIRDNFAAVIINVSGRRVALSVDEVIGEHEIVIKPIQAPLSGVRCVTGATLLDQNQIAIVLNPGDLIESSVHASVSRFAEEKPEKTATETLRILVVDDSITTRTLEKNILESKKYHVTTAVNGQEAWDILQKQSFSLMITDINMPVMDGFELTERVKKNDKLSSMPVIIVSSLGSDAEKARGMEAGADAYIVKNEFESGLLLQTIEQLV